MNIHFYLDNEEETQITSMYYLASNPFKIGDKISLNVEELNPLDYDKYRHEVKVKMINDNAEVKRRFNCKKIKLIRERKFVNFKVTDQAKLIIEYLCVYSDD
jgi:hypothetical protein